MYRGLPFFPLAMGQVSTDGRLSAVADRHQVGPAQVALAWLLQRSPVTVPIPGTGQVAHLEQNIAAASLRLTNDDLKVLDIAE